MGRGDDRRRKREARARVEPQGNPEKEGMTRGWRDEEGRSDDEFQKEGGGEGGWVEGSKTAGKSRRGGHLEIPSVTTITTTAVWMTVIFSLSQSRLQPQTVKPALFRFITSSSGWAQTCQFLELSSGCVTLFIHITPNATVARNTWRQMSRRAHHRSQQHAAVSVCPQQRCSLLQFLISSSVLLFVLHSFLFF